MANVATTGPVGQPLRRTYSAQVAGLSKGYAAIVGNSDQNVLSPSAQNAPTIGIIEESTINIGDAVSVVTSGECAGVVGAAVNAGQYLISDSQGRLIPGQGNVVGQARSSATTAGDEIVVFVSPDSGGGQDNVTHAVASAAIPVAPGTTGLGSAGALAMTLAQPTNAQDGVQIFITAETAHAHTVTTGANGINGSKHIVTFAAQGDGVLLEALAGVWNVRSLVGGAALS